MTLFADTVVDGVRPARWTPMIYWGNTFREKMIFAEELTGCTFQLTMWQHGVVEPLFNNALAVDLVAKSVTVDFSSAFTATLTKRQRVSINISVTLPTGETYPLMFGNPTIIERGGC